MEQRFLRMHSLATLVVFNLQPCLAAEKARLTVEKSALVVTQVQERSYRSENLIGARFTFWQHGKSQIVVLKSVLPTISSHGETILLHELVSRSSRGVTQNTCAPDVSGRRLAIPIVDADGQLSFACTGGAIAKCALWGYPPWQASRRINLPWRVLHEACVRMVRADYAGRGKAETRTGVKIWFCDRYGINKCEPPMGAVFEAVWQAKGARCVAQRRLRPRLELQRDQFVTTQDRGPRMTDCTSSFKHSNDLIMSYFRERT